VTAAMTWDELRMHVLASPAASGVVRDRFQRRLDAWGLAHLAADVLLCTGELVANAVAAAPAAEIRVRISRGPHGVLVEVWDPGNAMPVARPVVEPTLDDLDLSPENYDANGGWGLPIVAALSTACGFTPHPRTEARPCGRASRTGHPRDGPVRGGTALDDRCERRDRPAATT
jgi:anti-sigma regulatory factor (Ser/Thr protein kinase)